MILKPLKKPYELQVFEALDSRFTFTKKEMSYFHNLKLGYEGEKNFEQLLRDSFNDDYLIISDIRLEVGTTSFQIDSILLTGSTIHLIDVKNFSGDYKYDEKRWYKLPDKEITNPLLQLMRNETLMRQVLQQLHVNLPIESFNVFINPEFTLYQAPLNKYFIFPTQINRFINTLKNKAPVASLQHDLANQLIARDIGNYPHPSIPSYKYDQLNKGMRCRNCHCLSIEIVGRKCLCHKCKTEEECHQAVLRNITELQLLFPNEKLTTNLVYSWTGKVYSKKSLKRILDTHFKRVGSNKWLYYI
ncbi:nuclease-related domain-containing protein [Gracilibacillus suaedae]|uniref:nuclease-related domain-containing protein n=1 Tax=Gracilibacillus suaedae TaxID=2820273 RepID=UPI001ABE6C7A|nr:nuclease-related domain-containing protein [Gracilibacillus suaedae]